MSHKNALSELELNKNVELSGGDEKFREMFNHVADLIFINRILEDGSLGPIIEVNDAACKKTGYTRDELFEITQFKLDRTLNIGEFGEIISKLLMGESVSFEMFFSPKNGERVYVDISARIFHYNHETVALTVARDITERKIIEQKLIEKNEQLTKALDELEQAQKQLIQQEKLACIGQLAAGVAHEINNPMGFICSNIDISRMYCASFKETLYAYKRFVENLPHITAENIESEIQKLYDLEKKNNIDFILNDHGEMFDDIEDGLQRISEIVMGLKAFSRSDQDTEFDEYDLNTSIQKTLAVTRNDIKYHAGVKLSLGDIPRIKALGSKIDQVLLNIIINASDAIKDSKFESLGLITIITDQKDGFVRCQIEDNGIGIEKEHIGKIFDPFFTTKPTGRGTGIGLSIAYDIIVNQHNGQLLVESAPMAGSRFIILLPVDRGREMQVSNEK